MKAVLIRLIDDGTQTLGRLDVHDGTNLIWSCKTVELPWVGNQRNVSCIPVGKYNCVWSYSPAFKRNLFLVDGVVGRSGIRIHVANFVHQLRGCIAVGYNYQDIDKDGNLDVEMSGICLEAFNDLMTEKFELIIV